ncbi:TetR family transcriptional regulator [Streptomyces sp. NRRL F-4489]|uniref:TetR/AcrR family transcriptional regulator n=1 Tax=Streptomyces sp. NRRL F-4489 TaxID=1609095 RepID=UPI0007474E8D|nr:TetR/AcrR family transcriptional regulator [Streptomyces sp. NRRL F-4489]KUL51385.1 TetR family transcriptional regulator [Streptomyces sp. NRRL F-4489]
MTETMGRRERKKARTRQALADAALRLFLERGYDSVGVREVAEAADVSVTTLFKHFPSKESLVFDLDEDLEAGMVAAVRDRAPGRSALDALCEHLMCTRLDLHSDEPDVKDFYAMVETTPALRDYQDRMWLRHETALAAALAEAAGAAEGDLRCAALARFALQAPQLVRGTDDPDGAMREIFDLLERGWGNGGGEADAARDRRD